jgi:predicted nucleic acid-binding protein
MPSAIVSDSSCLILFHKIGRLSLLKGLFGQIIITSAVAEEFNRDIPSWIRIQDPTSNLHKGLITTLDLGEATSIALASEIEDSLLIVDEIKGRKVAHALNLTITGSLGILLMAKKKGLIQEVNPFLDEIKRTNFRISSALMAKILQLADE